MLILTRRYHFSAAHVLSRLEWEPRRNRAVYGNCANPAGHGHNYAMEVSVRGEVDPETGRLVPLERLDARVRRRVLDALDGRWLDREVPEFESRVPTAENIVRFAWRALEGEVSPAALHRIQLLETDNSSVEYHGDGEER